MTSLTTVVLDLGNVLIGWDPRRVWSPRLSDREIDAFLTESGFAELNRSLDGGRSFAEARSDLLERAPRHVATLDAYWEAFEQSLTGPIPGTTELVTELRDLGLRLLGLTNWSSETFHHAPVAAPAIAMLEDVLVSGREGIVKPDPAIFALLIARYGLEPDRTLFVDDSAANVDGARSAGLHAHLFTGADVLREELRRLGVRVAAAPS